MISFVSSLAIPIMILLIIVYALFMHTNAFDAFIKGGKEGIKTSMSIMPSLIALIVAIEMLSSSGVLNQIVTLFSPICHIVGIPKEIFPLSIMRSISGSGSLAIFQNILNAYGPDSFIGRCASVIMGSSETTFYTLTVYFAATSVKKTRHTLASALLADFSCLVAGCIVCSLFF